MNNPRDYPPDPNTQPAGPGEIRRDGATGSWKWVGGLAIAAIAALVARSPDFKNLLEEFSAGVTQPHPAPPPPAKPQVQAPVAKAPAAKPGPAAQAPFDDRARPVSFYLARWGVTEAQAPIGWTSRIDIRQGPGGIVVARVWITCPKGLCEAGEYPVTPVAHLQKKDMTAFLSMQRRDGDRMWTFLLRPAPGRPDELERWEWYGPPGTETRTQSVLGHVRRMKADGTFF
jgi:hypothetical protein